MDVISLPLTLGRNAVGCKALHSLDAAPRRLAPRVIKETPVGGDGGQHGSCLNRTDRAQLPRDSLDRGISRETGSHLCGGISAETVGAQAIWLGMIRMPP